MRKIKQCWIYLGFSFLISFSAKAIPAACYPNSQFNGNLRVVPNLCDLQGKGYTKGQCETQAKTIAELHGPQWSCFWNSYRTDCELTVFSRKEPSCSSHEISQDCNNTIGCIWYPWK